MITKQEVMNCAREFSLPANTVEKDYVLGWLLAGIEHHETLFKKWVFKGGTCLKKCYFETYRFSEDLDYTLTDEKQLDENFLTDCFKKIAAWIYDTVGIELPVETIRFEVYKNKVGKISVEGRVGYIGPLQRRGDPVRIKLDLTADEVLVQEPVSQEVHHPYSDKPVDGIKSYCYSFSEIFAEKIRALSERARPRDLYDVVHLYRHARPGVNSAEVFEVLKKKCEYKSIPVSTISQLKHHPKRHELEKEWSNMLAHQLPMLPPREQFWDELPVVFDWLHGTGRQEQLLPAPDPKEKIDKAWFPPSMIQSWHMTIPLELVRYAGANHLCIEVICDGVTNVVEPYDLKKNQEGYFILITVERHTGELCAYHADHIQNISVTQHSFVPRYLISLTPFWRPI